MRKLVSIVATFALLGIGCSTARESEPDQLSGVWKRVSIYFHESEKTMTDSTAHTIFTRDHYSYIDGNGLAHWGTYSHSGDTLVLHRVQSTNPEAQGSGPRERTVKFEDGDLVLSWNHPAGGPIDVRMKRIE